eukprot:4590076-Prymnesium_polylepis.1
MPEWGDRVECPEFGAGWFRLSKPRPAPSNKAVDHIWVNPLGQRFRSIKAIQEFLSGAVPPKAPPVAAASKAPAKPPPPSDKPEAKKKGKPEKSKSAK